MNLKGVLERFKPHLLMVLVQFGYTFLYFITEASFHHGLNPHVYVTYRHLLAGLVMFPFAYFLERKARPKLTSVLCAEIFALSLMGVGLALNTYFASFKYTSTTFIASATNSLASLTFVIAVVLRLEVIDVRNPRGIAKVLGTIVSLGGVMTMTLYKGSVIRTLLNPLIQIHGKTVFHENWSKGSVLVITCCVSWSVYFIMQAYIVKIYPARLSLTTWMCFVGAAQSAVYTLIVEHKTASWRIGINIEFWSILYGAVVSSALAVFFQLYCTKLKGPVFVTMFNPLGTILVTFLAYFVMGQKLYIGSIIGAIIVIIGLYLLLWGKEGDQKINVQPQEISDSTSEETCPKIDIIASEKEANALCTTRDKARGSYFREGSH